MFRRAGPGAQGARPALRAVPVELDLDLGPPLGQQAEAAAYVARADGGWREDTVTDASGYPAAREPEGYRPAYRWLPRREGTHAASEADPPL